VSNLDARLLNLERRQAGESAESNDLLRTLIDEVRGLRAAAGGAPTPTGRFERVAVFGEGTSVAIGDNEWNISAAIPTPFAVVSIDGVIWTLTEPGDDIRPINNFWISSNDAEVQDGYPLLGQYRSTPAANNFMPRGEYHIPMWVPFVNVPKYSKVYVSNPVNAHIRVFWTITIELHPEWAP